MSGLELDNAFWRFSLLIYEQPGVAPECIALQEAAGIDVNVLLFCAWVGAELGVALSDSDLEDVSRRVSAWQEQIVRPLRAVRRNLRKFGDHPDLGSRVASLELAAEQVEQAILFSVSLDRWHRNCFSQPEASVQTNLTRLLRQNGGASAGRWPARLVEASLQRGDKLRRDTENQE